MILAIIQLNDIHIKDSSNPALGRIDSLVAAVRSLNVELEGCILAAPGDIAYSGLGEEYNLADAFFRETMSRLEQEFPGVTPQVIFSPGNHDCNLRLSTDVRQRTILDPRLQNLDVTGAVTSNWLAVQDSYFAFVAAFGQNHRSNEEKIALRKDFTVAKTYTIGVTTYNTAWLSENPEVPGTLCLPLSWLREVLEPPRDIEISIFHHPYNWLDPNNAHQVKKFIEARSDLVLTGHEHRADSYAKTGPDTGPVSFIEGPAMYDPREPKNGFNVLLMDLSNRRWQLHQFTWDRAGRFLPQSTATWSAFLRNRQLAERGFENNEVFERELRDPGTGFTHSKRAEIQLGDLFVYPALVQRELQRKVEGTTASPYQIEGQDLFAYVASQGRMLILGAELSGKTSLAKVLYKQFQQQSQLVPLLIKGTELRDASDANTLIDRLFSKQYSSSPW